MEMGMGKQAPAGGGEGLKEITEMGGDPKNPFTSMVAGVSTALSKMQELLSGEGVGEDLVAKLGDINEQYKATLAEIMQSMGGEKGPESDDAGRMPADAGPRGIPA